MDDLELAFGLYADESTGQISLPNASKVARGLGFNFTSSHFQIVVSEFGITHAMSLDDLRMAMAKLDSDITKETLMEAFGFFDAMQSGTVSGEELRAILGSWNDKLTAEEIEAFMRAGGYKDGSTISIDTFCETMLKGTRAEFC